MSPVARVQYLGTVNENPTLDAARTAYRRGDYEEASRLYEQILPVADPDLLTTVRSATCKLALGDLYGAEALFLSGLRRSPGDPSLVTGLGAVWQLMGKEWDAAKLYREVLLKPGDGVACLNVGHLMLTHGNPAGSIQCLARALEAPPASAPSVVYLPSFKADGLPASAPDGMDSARSMGCLLLGLNLGELGRFDDARACFERAMELNDRNTGAYCAMALTAKAESGSGPLMERMGALARDPSVTRSDRAQLLFALGKAKEDLGDFESAMGCFVEANQLRRRLVEVPYDASASEREIERIAATYPQEPIEVEAGSTSDLPLLIVGMMRSGTTLVEQIVASHPEVGSGGELKFWGSQGDPATRSGARVPSDQEAKDFADAYLSLLRSIDGDAKRVTDKTPHNFVALGLVNCVFPNARIICCRRSPIDTCLSIFTNHFQFPFPFASDRTDLVNAYRQFDRLMSHWKGVIPSDRLMEVDYEQLLTDRETVTRRIIDFCGLEWDDACLSPERRPGAVKTASVWQVRQGVYRSSIERWRRYEPWLGELRELLD